MKGQVTKSHPVFQDKKKSQSQRDKLPGDDAIKSRLKSRKVFVSQLCSQEFQSKQEPPSHNISTMWCHGHSACVSCCLPHTGPSQPCLLSSLKASGTDSMPASPWTNPTGRPPPARSQFSFSSFRPKSLKELSGGTISLQHSLACLASCGWLSPHKPHPEHGAAPARVTTASTSYSHRQFAILILHHTGHK